VTDTGDIAPIDLKSEASSLVNDATTVVEKKVQTIIATQAVLQLMHQINSLDAAQQKEIRSIVCSSESGVIK
jgi:hypothetical protein